MKHKILNLSILLLTLSLFFTNTIKINAQQTDIGIVEPSVAAFIQYGTYPVDLSSGLPNISIPLYTISAGNLNLPLTLMYHAGGIKVDEEASWVGLGWSINYGGMISREIHGLPDEMEDFSQMPTDDDITAFIESNPDAYTSPYLVNLALGLPECSFEPDIYHIVAGNISSKYILNEENKPVFFPDKPILINENYKDLGAPFAYKRIVADNGTIYDFKDADLTQKVFPHPPEQEYKSTWHISRIISANKKDTIICDYQNDGISTNVLNSYHEGFSYKSQCNTCNEPGFYDYSPIQPSQDISKINTKSVKPEYIYFKNGRVRFILEDRDDIFCNLDTPIEKKHSKRLQEIIIERKKKDGQYVQLKRIEFAYTYFISNNPQYDSQGKILPKYIKLKLDSILEYGSSNTEKSKNTLFNYNCSQQIHQKNSFAQDYWGYPNDQISNSSLIPIKIMRASNNKTYSIGGAIKTPNLEYCKTASLKSITYPTSGKTVFEWEQNDYYSEDGPVAYPMDIYTKSAYLLSDSGCLHTDDPHPLEPLEHITTEIFEINNQLSQEAIITYFQRRSEEWVGESHKKYDSARIEVYDVDDWQHPIFSTCVIDEYGHGDHSETVYLNEGITYRFHVYRNCVKVKNGLSISYLGLIDSLSENNVYPMGGLRIKSISNYNEDTIFENGKQYIYMDPGNRLSSGNLITRQTLQYTTNQLSSQLSECSTGYNSSPFLYNVLTNQTIINSSPVEGAYSNTVFYTHIQESSITDQREINGYIQKEYSFVPDVIIGSKIKPYSMNWLRGKLLQETIYNKDSVLIQKTINKYSIDTRINNLCRTFKLYRHISYTGFEKTFCKDYPLSYIFSPVDYDYVSHWQHLDTTLTIQYFPQTNDSITTKVTYTYNNPSHQNPSFINTKNSNGETYVDEILYPDDINNNSVIQSMIDANMINTVMEKKTKINQNIISGHKNHFQISNNQIHPEIEEFFGSNMENIKTIYYNNFDIKGNLTQYKNEAGIFTTYLWGYNYSKPIAKIENATYDETMTLLNITYSKLQTMNSEELMDIFINLRENTIDKNIMITSFTHDPLIGITSITSPNGIENNFEYDHFQRLESTKDDSKNILKYIEYYYK